MIFHEFNIGDVEDPEIYAGHPLWEWQQTEAGKWVMQHCSNPTYKTMIDQNTYGYKVIIYGDLSAEDATYFTLKYR
jgi:hypothetical protein